VGKVAMLLEILILMNLLASVGLIFSALLLDLEKIHLNAKIKIVITGLNTETLGNSQKKSLKKSLQD